MVRFLLPHNVVHYCFFFFHLLLLLFPISYTSSSLMLPLCNHHDSSALLQFTNSFVVDALAVDALAVYALPSENSCYNSYKTASWKNGTDCCRWDGVTCDTVSGRVIGLDLSCSNLQGELHPNSTLFQLTHLQQLNLAFNDFSGSSISSGIGGLVSLTHLNLSKSAFRGDIPSSISHLSKLVSLDLSTDFSLTRLDPSTWNKLIMNATNLQEIVLDDVDMSSVRESSLSLLMNFSSSLVSLTLSSTSLRGNFPTAILCLSNLQELSLSDNEELKGELPRSNWSTPLRLLDLSATDFSGEIPDFIGHLKSLEVLSLSSCRFDGFLPISLWNLTQLTSLDLQSNHFSGHILDVFASFTKLEYFSVSSNNLGGQLPSSLFSLSQMSILDFSNNKLVGPIPSKNTKLSKLRILRLSNNLLNGTIPLWCYSLPSLSLLHLNNNKLTGSIGEFFTHSLQDLALANNKLQGNFPDSIFELKNLTTLNLSTINLSGLVDFYQFSRLENLISLDLSDNNFLINISVDYILPNLQYLYLSSCNVTSFPPFLARLQDLFGLDLSYNNIHGEIPKWFNDNLLLSWKDIQYIDLSFNNLHGDLPIPPYEIQFFSVSNNKFTGDISSTLCNASSLFLLNLSHNNFSGMIPECKGTFPYLSVLDLQMNNLYGSISGNFFTANSLKTIKLNGNRLEGPLPPSLVNCTMLEVLDLGDNNIEDLFPSWLETLLVLQVLILRANKFHGMITNFNTEHPFPKLRIFDVSNNNFSGPLPTSYFKNFQGMMNVNESQTDLKYMSSDSDYGSYNDSVMVTIKGQFLELDRILTIFTTIDLSKNMFEGEIPHVIGELHSLKGLNLSHNGITGTIPRSLGNLRNLEWLDLSWNQLEGEIPMALTNLNFLSVLNISQNQLEGIIPTGKQFNTFQNDSYGGNPMLCGTPLSKSCSGTDEEQPPPSTFHDEEESGFGWKSVTVGYACGVVFGMVLGCCCFLSGKPLWLARLVGMPNPIVKRRNNRARANHRRMN